MIQQCKDPNRLHLVKCMLPRSTTYFIVYKQRNIGQVESVPINTMDGKIDPPILLNRPFSEGFCDRIRDLVNKRDKTNRDVMVNMAPPGNHPAILKYMERKLKLTW